MEDDTLIIDLVSPLIARETYIAEYQKGNFTTVGVTIAVNDGSEASFKTISEWQERFTRMNDELLHVLKSEDIAQAYKQNKLGIIFHFQNTNPLDGNIDLVKTYYELGVRVMQITYNAKNKYGCGCEVEIDTGLTEAGHELINKMNTIGMLVDVSHAGYKTAFDTIAISTQPVILSHSNALSLCKSDRNVPDELIKAIAQTKGVIGLNAFSPLVTNASPQATLNQLLDHAEYIVNLVGIDHISLGLDYYTGQWPYVSDEAAIKNYNRLIKQGVWNARNYPKPPHKYVAGLETPDKINNLKSAFLERGFSMIDIKKILGENLTRVFSDVWKV